MTWVNLCWFAACRCSVEQHCASLVCWSVVQLFTGWVACSLLILPGDMGNENSSFSPKLFLSCGRLGLCFDLDIVLYLPPLWIIPSGQKNTQLCAVFTVQTTVVCGLEKEAAEMSRGRLARDSFWAQSYWGCIVPSCAALMASS